MKSNINEDRIARDARKEIRSKLNILVTPIKKSQDMYCELCKESIKDLEKVYVMRSQQIDCIGE